MKKLLLISFFIFLATTISLLSQEFMTYTTANSGLPGNDVRAICIDANGVKWFGTADGLCSFDGTNWSTFFPTSAKQTLADKQINDLAFEVSSFGPELWIATENGVSVAAITGYDALTFATPYRTDNTGLVANPVKVTTVDPGHVRWFGTASGVSSFDGTAWGSYTVENFWIYHNNVKSLTSGPDSMVYIGTEGTGVSRLKMSPFDGVTAASAIDWSWSQIVSDSVYAIYVQENGYQWFGTDHGVSLHTSYNTREDWVTYTTNDGLIHNFVQAIAEDQNGHLWFGTRGGVSRFDGIQWQSYTTADGLADNQVVDIAEDAEGTIWLATPTGLSKFTKSTAVETNMSSVSLKNLYIKNFPNPFNMQTTIEFSLPQSGNTAIIIYNLMGQQVRELFSGELTSGTHSIQWDGQDDYGIDVQAGIYFSAITANSLTITRKIVLVK